MVYDASFVVSVLEGFEASTEELKQGVGENQKLLAGLDVLKSRITSLRVSLDPGPDRIALPRSTGEDLRPEVVRAPG